MLSIAQTSFLSLICHSGFAIRRMEHFPEGDSVHPLNKLMSLIQEGSGVDLTSVEKILKKSKRLTEGITPEAKKSLNAALTEALGEIEQEVDVKIKKMHQETQKVLDDQLDSLSATTNTAVVAKKDADANDNLWIACREEEKQKVITHEFAIQDEAAKNASTLAPCAEQKSLSGYSKEYNEDDFIFKCDLSVTQEGTNCEAKLKEFEDKVSQVVEDLTAEVGVAEEKYTNAKSKCDAAMTAWEEAKTAVKLASAGVNIKKQHCMELHEERSLSMCKFGDDLKTKCDSKAKHDITLADLDRVGGNEYSEADRMKEWEATHVTKCILQKIIDTEQLNDVQIDSTTISDCKAKVNYVDEVGKIERNLPKAAALGQGEKFSCQEDTFSFSGEIWNVPENAASADYQKMEYHPQVDINKSVFAFCAHDSKHTCASFQCDGGKPRDASMQCQLTDGCTQKECCS